MLFPLLIVPSVGIASAASAFDSAVTGRPSQVSPAHCAELEEARKNTDASRCWWYAAEELNRYATSDHSLTDDVKELRSDWLWRGVRLSLQSPDQRTGPDPARVAGRPVPCASILSSDYEKCLGVVPPEPEKTEPKKKVRKAAGAEPKAETSAVRKKARKKIVFEPAAARQEEAALPLVPEVGNRTNLTPRHLSRKSLNTAAIPDWWR